MLDVVLFLLFVVLIISLVALIKGDLRQLKIENRKTAGIALVVCLVLISFASQYIDPPNDEVAVEEEKEEEERIHELIPADVRLVDDFDVDSGRYMDAEEEEAKNAEEHDKIVDFVESWNDYVQDSTHNGYLEKHVFEIDYDDVKLKSFTDKALVYEYSMQPIVLELTMGEGIEEFYADIYFDEDALEIDDAQGVAQDAIFSWQLYLASYLDDVDMNEAENILADMGELNDVNTVMDIENYDWPGEYPEIIYDYDNAEILPDMGGTDDITMIWFDNPPGEIALSVHD